MDDSHDNSADTHDTISEDKDEDNVLGQMFTVIKCSIISSPGKNPPTPPPPESTYAIYERPALSRETENGNVKSVLSIRLVGTHPLWGHHLWNAARAFAVFLERNSDRFCRERNVLELGAGGGLPGIITALCGAKRVVLTDYPDQELLENLKVNVKANVPTGSDCIDVQGYIWGRDVSDLISPQGKFDLILMSDLIFNHSQHDALLQSAESCLLEPEDTKGSESDSSSTPCVLAFYTHHRPHLADRDMQFFTKAQERGWACEKILEEKFEPMFPEDSGDSNVRATVHGWRLTHPKRLL